MMRKLFFMIAEFFGGKKRLAEKFPKKLDTINDFYAKEFKISADKITSIKNIYNSYQNKSKNFTTEPENKENPIKDAFSKKLVWLNAKELEASIKDSDIIANLDPIVLKKLIEEEHIQLENKDNITMIDDEGNTVIDKSKILETEEKTIIEKIMKNKTIWSAVKRTYEKNDQFVPEA
jgi:hypothetical protein